LFIIVFALALVLRPMPSIHVSAVIVFIFSAWKITVGGGVLLHRPLGTARLLVDHKVCEIVFTEVVIEVSWQHIYVVCFLVDLLLQGLGHRDEGVPVTSVIHNVVYVYHFVPRIVQLFLRDR
jgi:hypothetical protein